MPRFSNINVIQISPKIKLILPNRHKNSERRWGLRLQTRVTVLFFSIQLRSQGAGAIVLPIGLKSMQNNTFLVLLRPIFAPKMKTAPPTGLGSRSCEGLALIWTKKVEFFFWSAPKVGQEK